MDDFDENDAIGEGVKLPNANGNAPRTEKEKQNIIKKAAKAYEKYLDALGFDWRNDPNSSNTPMRVAKDFVNVIASGFYNEPPSVTAFPTDGYDGVIAQCNIPVKSLCSHHHLAFTGVAHVDRKSTRLNSSHRCISYAVFCLKKKKNKLPHRD